MTVTASHDGVGICVFILKVETAARVRVGDVTAFWIRTGVSVTQAPKKVRHRV